MLFKFSIKEFLSKNIVFFMPLCLSLAVWMNPHFFTPESFINYGDMAFPLDPKLLLKSMAFLWIESNGTGVPSVYSPFLFPSLICWILDFINIPLWIINRLWVILPLASVGWATYYLYRSIMRNKYAMIGGIIAAIFAMFTPGSEIYSYQYFSLTGFALSFAVLIRLLDGNEAKFTYLLAGLCGITLLFFTPRYLYMALLSYLLYVIFWFIIRKKIEIRKLKQILMISIAIIFFIAYLLIPLGAFYLMHRSSLVSELYSSDRTPVGYQTGLELWEQYKSWITPLWAMRLLTSNPYSPLTPLMKVLFISLISFIMPGYAFLSLVLNRNKKLVLIAVLSLCFLLLAVSPTNVLLRRCYLFLYKSLPGFFIFKSPAFFILFLGIFYALLTGATTQALIIRIEENKKILLDPEEKKRLKYILISSLVLVILFVYGAGLLIGKSPRKSLAGWGDVIYANHTPSAEIPQEYFSLGEYFKRNVTASDPRVLNLPWTRGGYIPYRWWNYYDMPEVMNALSPLPVLGASFPPKHGWLVSLANAIEKKDTSNIMKLLRLLRIRYILIHKDYVLPDSYEHVCKYIEYLQNDRENFTQVMDNAYFVLFRAHFIPEKFYSI